MHVCVCCEKEREGRRCFPSSQFCPLGVPWIPNRCHTLTGSDAAIYFVSVFNLRRMTTNMLVSCQKSEIYGSSQRTTYSSLLSPSELIFFQMVHMIHTAITFSDWSRLSVSVLIAPPSDDFWSPNVVFNIYFYFAADNKASNSAWTTTLRIKLGKNPYKYIKIFNTIAPPNLSRFYETSRNFANVHEISQICTY